MSDPHFISRLNSIRLQAANQPDGYGEEAGNGCGVFTDILNVQLPTSLDQIFTAILASTFANVFAFGTNTLSGWETIGQLKTLAVLPPEGLQSLSFTQYANVPHSVLGIGNRRH